MSAASRGQDTRARRGDAFFLAALRRLALTGGLLAAAGVAWAAAVDGTGGSEFAGADPEKTTHLLRQAWDQLLAAPAPIYFGIVAVGLVGPLPVSVFYVAAGPIFGIGPALAWFAPTLALNAVLVHAIGTTAVRPRLAAWIEGRGLRVPLLEDPSDQLLFASVVRITPGIPYFLQSWAIVLAGIRRPVFVVLSVGVQMIYATGFVVLGRGAFEGRLGLAATAIAFLVVAGLVARHVHRRLRGRAPELLDTNGEAAEDEANTGSA